MYGIFFSDLHLHYWTKYNKGSQRTQGQMGVLEFLFQLAMKYKVPLFFTGDMFHSPIGLSNSLLSIVLPQLMELFNKYPIELYAISGNHDLEGINTIVHRSPSYINTFANSIKNFHCLDFESKEFDNFAVHGIPYLTHNIGYEEAVNNIELVPGKKNLLLVHGDYKGQKDTNGIVIGKGENVNEEDLRKFDLVISGHVHKKGHLRNNLYSIGSPNQLRLSDLGGTFGYWTLKRRFKLSFKEIDWMPQFRMYSKDSDKTNGTDFWVKEPKSEEEIESILEDELDYRDLGGIGKQYIKATGLKSRRKRLLLLDIIEKTEDTE